METVELHSVSTELERFENGQCLSCSFLMFRNNSPAPQPDSIESIETASWWKGVEISVVNEQVASVILMQEKAFFQWR